MDTMSAPAIEVTGLRKSFGDTTVLTGVDLDVRPGEIFALLGSNGAGKTTTVAICSTLLKPDAGRVTVAGHDVVTQPALVRRAISLTGQLAAVDEVLTGRENLELVARLRRCDRPREVASRLLEQLGLDEVADRGAGTCSGGMRRRLDIAMSLVGSPAILFLDEPTTGLDPEARRDLWSTVRELAAGGTTVLLTTQYLDEAERLADRIAILHRGAIIATGTVAELRSLYGPGTVEYVRKQPTLEEIFLAVVGEKEAS